MYRISARLTACCLLFATTPLSVGCGGPRVESAADRAVDATEASSPSDQLDSAVVRTPSGAKPASGPDVKGASSQPQSGVTAAQLAAQSDALDRSLWAHEVQSQRHEEFFIKLWDDLRASRDPFEVLLRIPLESLAVGEKIVSRDLEQSIRLTRYAKPANRPSVEISAEALRAWLTAFHQKGFQITQTEWHHSTFHPATKDRPARSEVSFEIDLAHAKQPHTLALRGQIGVEWSPDREGRGAPTPRRIDASNVTLLERQGVLPFRAAMKVEPQPQQASDSVMIEPLIVVDLNHDGLPEVIMAGAGAVMWNRGGFRFERKNLFEKNAFIRNSGAVADFDGDGRDDFLGVNADGHAVLYAGDGQGAFPSPPRRPWEAKAEGPSAITVGDVDADGDLDVWFTQYKAPYRGGQMPTPYYDANDGYPSYLLLNDGRGNFRDATQAAGLAGKRHRRTYSASLVDLDDDGDLDLMVVSDFSGLDLYANDGRGRFTDVTEHWASDRQGFGMSHTLGDFDRDGRLDLYVVGMSSTTARRLERLGLRRSEFADYDARRADMTYGNRMLLARGDRYVQTGLGEGAARTGWAWGCDAFDWDNDADDDLYVANGHVSGRSAKDYCTRYWCHDVYVGASRPSAEVARFLTDEFRPASLRGLDDGAISWNGYEHKKLLLNVAGKEFVDVAPLVGVAYEFDGRAVVATDLDGDGRLDLLIVRNDWSTPTSRIVGRQSLYVLANELPTTNHWIGARLVSRRPGVSAIGAKVTIRGPFGARDRRIITGDSYYAQHPTTAHFGLADATRVDEIVVRWPDGSQSSIKKPGVDRYHEIALEAANDEPARRATP